MTETLCVSPQTISKWENSVNLPDVQMLPRSDSAVRAIDLPANADFRRALAFVLEHGMRNFTMPFLCKKVGVEDAQALERCLTDSGLVEVRELMVDEQPMSFYGLVNQHEKLLALMAALTYCAGFTDWAGIFCCCHSSADTFD